MNVKIADELRGIARLGILELDGMRDPRGETGALWAELEKLSGSIAKENAGKTAGQVVGVDEARALYRKVGLDPTKTRPSSEALLRRVIKGKGLYRIHPLVDLFNLASLESLLPVGLYDLSRVVGDEVVVRIGAEGWGFDGIRKDRVNVAGRLCVADEQGPFGSPTSDSARTSIEGHVESALAIFFAPADGVLGRLRGALERASSLARTYLGAREVRRYILDGRDETA